MTKPLPVGKMDMGFLSGLLAQHTDTDATVVIGAKIGEDAAVVDLGDRYLVTKTNPITFATNEIGWYVVNVCVNNMVVRGVRPRWMLNCILLPEGETSPEMVEEILQQIHSACSEVGVLVIGGHTEVTAGLGRPIVVGHLLGEVAKEALVATSTAEIDDVVLVTKALGVEGTAIIASELAGDLRGKGYSADFVERARRFLYEPGISVYKDALTAADSRLVHAMTDATEGGLASALHEMAEAAGVGFLIEGEKVPVYAETKRICAEYNLDPLGLIASGMLIMAVPASSSDELCNKMMAEGVQCTAIGTVTDATEGLQLLRGGKCSDLPYYAVEELTKLL
jgi:hydrogenase maturation factor